MTFTAERDFLSLINVSPKNDHGYCTAAKIVDRGTLFTIHNGVKSATAIDLNKREDLHNN